MGNDNMKQQDEDLNVSRGAVLQSDDTYRRVTRYRVNYIKASGAITNCFCHTLQEAKALAEHATQLVGIEQCVLLIRR